MTHTQNSLSFEVALIDGMICCNDGKENVLVGAADESIEFLENLRGSLITSDRPFTTGATFFVLGKKKSEVQLLDCQVSFNHSDIEHEMNSFLKKNGVEIKDLSIIAHSGIDLHSSWKKQVNYQDYSGLYYSSSAFGFHIAHDYLKNTTDSEYALIINAQSNSKYGFTLLKKVK